MIRSDKKLNEGARLLKARALKSRDLADQLGITHTSVLRHLKGEKLPSREVRAQIAALFPEIEPRLWDVVKRTSKRASKRKPKRTAVKIESVAQGRGETERRLRAQIRRLESRLGDDMTASQQMSVERAIIRATEALGKLRGELGEISESTIVRHPKWQRIMKTAWDSLQPFPDAHAAFVEALRALGDG